MGRLAVLEGIDGCGKSTQLEKLGENLTARGVDFRSYSFPDYTSNSGALIREYLNGAFGSRPGDVNAWAASAFYAVDRYASYKKHWAAYYAAGGNVVAGRYTSSNAVHQMAKLPEKDRADFLSWLTDFEYGRLQIPRPDLILFLDMPPAVAETLLENRYAGGAGEKDIHERDTAYLESCRAAGLYAADVLGWRVIPCAAGGAPRPADEIAGEVLEAVLAVF